MSDSPERSHHSFFLQMTKNDAHKTYYHGSGSSSAPIVPCPGSLYPQVGVSMQLAVALLHRLHLLKVHPPINSATSWGPDEQHRNSGEPSSDLTVFTGRTDREVGLGGTELGNERHLLETMCSTQEPMWTFLIQIITVISPDAVWTQFSVQV